jgi:Leucine-rich repeat (LRR) protein
MVLILLTACESYDFTINEKRVYTAKPLFSQFDTPDPALYECLKQRIIDEKITSASELTSLNCSHAGIANLQGLGVFTGLTHLKLSSNKIRNLVEISTMPVLRELYLDNNVVVDPVPLQQVLSLRLLDLSHNTTLQCPKAQGFPLVESLTLPKHCG